MHPRGGVVRQQGGSIRPRWVEAARSDACSVCCLSVSYYFRLFLMFFAYRYSDVIMYPEGTYYYYGASYIG